MAENALCPQRMSSVASGTEKRGGDNGYPVIATIRHRAGVDDDGIGQIVLQALPQPHKSIWNTLFMTSSYRSQPRKSTIRTPFIERIADDLLDNSPTVASTELTKGAVPFRHLRQYICRFASFIL